MKSIALVLFISISFMSCDKISDPDLIGKWRLEGISGGFTGGGYIAAFEFLNIVDNKNCEWLDSINNIVDFGTYKLSTSNGNNCIYFKLKVKSNSFYFDSDLKYTFYSNDTLYLAPRFECNDCYDYLFIKEK